MYLQIRYITLQATASCYNTRINQPKALEYPDWWLNPLFKEFRQCCLKHRRQQVQEQDGFDLPLPAVPRSVGPVVVLHTLLHCMTLMYRCLLYRIVELWWCSSRHRYLFVEYSILTSNSCMDLCMRQSSSCSRCWTSLDILGSPGRFPFGTIS
jgi:hypothetical protein